MPFARFSSSQQSRERFGLLLALSLPLRRSLETALTGGGLTGSWRRLSRLGSCQAQTQWVWVATGMDDEEETYRLWKIRKTIMQVSAARSGLAAPGEPDTQRPGGWVRGGR